MLLLLLLRLLLLLLLLLLLWVWQRRGGWRLVWQSAVDVDDRILVPRGVRVVGGEEGEHVSVKQVERLAAVRLSPRPLSGHLA